MTNALAEQVRFTQQFVDGSFVDAADGGTFPVVSPGSGATVTAVSAGGKVDIDRAVAAARRSFDSGVWSAEAPAVRKRKLLALAELIRRNCDELATLITLDMGKPIGDARGEVNAAAGTVQYYAEAVDKLFGEVAPTGPNALTTITREPIGVVGAIVPWNYPLNITCWKLAPALAAGNSVVVKPSEKAPLASLRLAALVAEADIPVGVVNVVPGFGDPAGKALALHHDVDALTFTGSTAVGRKLLTYAGESNMKAVSLECGGKSPNIVLADVADLDVAAAHAVQGAFENMGEMCNSGTRLLVHESLAEEMVANVVARTANFAPGDPFDPQTVMGPLVDAGQLERVLGYVDLGKTEGARLETGGGRARPESGGYFVDPAVFSGVSNTMSIAREEIFGPVLSVISFRDTEEAVRLANDSIYGLAAAVWTRDITTAHTVARRLRAGSVYINCYDYGDIAVPFGGYKQSGIGRDKSLHAIDKYTQLKTTWLNLG